MSVDYYRKVDLIKEFVVAKGETISTPKDLTTAPNEFNRGTKMIGSNRIIDGVSVRCPSYLLKFFNRLNSNIEIKYNKLNSKIETSSKQYYTMERNVTSKIAGLHSDPEEKLSKGFAYTAIGAMTGSIVSRKRNILFRFAMPILFGTVICSYVLPTTFENTTALIHDMQEERFPKYTAKQDRVMGFILTGIDHTIMTYDMIRDALSASRDYLQQHANFS